MPEIPEICIMTKFINDELGYCDDITIDVNPIYKSNYNKKEKNDISPLFGKKWKVSARSRGKEMILTFYNTKERVSVKVGFARIGNVEKYSYDQIDTEKYKKHSMLRMLSADKIITISDFTRYIIWRICDEWDTARSPDPLLEHEAWQNHLYDNRNFLDHRKVPYYDRPIFELMGDQRHFNGIGAFCKTEILARTRFSPFTPLSHVLRHDILRNDFFETTRIVLQTIIDLGGLQFEHWKNPYIVDKHLFNLWVKCYSKTTTYFTVDKEGRKLWFLKKWSFEFEEWCYKNNRDDKLRKMIYIFNKTKKLKNGNNSHNNTTTG